MRMGEALTKKVIGVSGRVPILQVGHADAGGDAGKDAKAEDADNGNLPAGWHLQVGYNKPRQNCRNPVCNHLNRRYNVTKGRQSDNLLAGSPIPPC